MEAIPKYSLNPLATCFFPSNMNLFCDSVTLDQSISNNLPRNDKCATSTFGNGFPIVKNYWAQNSGTISVSKMLDMDLLIYNENTATEEPSLIVGRNPTVRMKRLVVAERPGKLNGNGISKRRFKNGISLKEVCGVEQERFKDKVNKKTDLMEPRSVNCINSCLELERFEDSPENICFMEPERNKINSNICLIEPEKSKDSNIRSVEPEQSENNSRDKNCLVESKRSNNISDNCLMKLNTDKITDIVKIEENSKISTVGVLFTSDSLNLELYRWTKRNLAVSFYIAWLLSSAYCPPIEFNGNATEYASRATFGKTDKLEKDYVPFGCKIPLEFNRPLKLPKICNKKSVLASFDLPSDENASNQIALHSCIHISERQSVDSGNCSEDESYGWTEEIASHERCAKLAMELKSIIKDVYDTVQTFASLDDSEIEQPTRIHSKPSKHPVWLTSTFVDETEQNLDLIDDGYHPLLDDPPVADEDFTEDIALIQKFLGKAMAFGEKSFEEVEPQHSTCNPPCSVWCNSVPSHAVDTYKRFIKKLKSDYTVHRKVETCKIPRRPFYKRSFSADDSPQVFDHENVPNLATDFELKEKLLLLNDRADSKDLNVTYFDGSHKYGSSTISLEQDRKKFAKGKSSDTWSLYDSVDSMWQRLPDCVPSSDHSQKHSRRARDMRRQRSVC